MLDHIPGPDPDWTGAQPDPATSSAPYRLYNIGNSQPVELLQFIACIEGALGRKAKMNFLSMQPGDVPDTCADIASLSQAIGFHPTTQIEEGIARFVAWYREFYHVPA